MNTNKKNKVTENKPQTSKDVEGLPIKNAMTDSKKNTALQKPGLNQEKTKEDNTMPSDGDNLTNT